MSALFHDILANIQVASTPTASMAQSTPRPPVISKIRCTASSLAELMVWLHPTLLPSPSGYRPYRLR